MSARHEPSDDYWRRLYMMGYGRAPEIEKLRQIALLTRQPDVDRPAIEVVRSIYKRPRRQA